MGGSRIDKIIEAIMAATSGNYSVQLGLSGENDEFDILAKGVNAVIAKLKEKEESLKQMEKELKAIADNYFWQSEELKARNEEFGVYADLLQKQQIELEKHASKIVESNKQLQEEITNREIAEQELKEYAERLEEMVEERTKELRDAQEQLVRREKLAVLGQLASGIGHELRNPLGVIGNSAYYLNMKLKSGDEKVKKHLGILNREVQRSNEIITDLLDYSRTKSPSAVETNVKDIVEDALADVEIPESIVVETSLDADLPAILLDPEQIRRVFLNFLTNAVGAMPEGGKLEVKAGINGDFFEIMFRDTGEGIPKENFKKIFEPLFTTKAKGIGLGLAIVKSIVDRHNGEIEVESDIGMGTTFTVKLPRQGKEVV